MKQRTGNYSVLEQADKNKNTNFDFLRWRVHALVLSWIIILAGVAVTRDGALLVSDDANGTIFRVARK